MPKPPASLESFPGQTLLCLAALVGCAGRGAQPSTPPGVSLASITLTSRSFEAKGAIPIDHTCDGKDLSPQLSWSSPPQGTRSLTLEVEDPDASPANFTHWVAYNLPPDVLSVAEGADIAALHGMVGVNDFPDTGYRGPCPPHRETHRYVFHLFAVDTILAVHEGANRAAVDAAMAHHVLGEGQLMGNFGH